MDELSTLSSEERVKRYRELASRARRDAANATGTTRGSYLALAAQWDTLAAYTQSLGAYTHIEAEFRSGSLGPVNR